MISDPIRPPSFPLAVRTPYLSTWVRGDHEGIIDQSVEFWNGQKLGWTGLLRVNGTVYSIFGAVPAEISSSCARQLSQHYTPSSSNFRFEAAGVLVELIFTNSITPTDYKRQSIPFSYLEVVLSSISSGEMVELYFDVNGAWLSGDVKNFVSWDMSSATLGNKQSFSNGESLASHRIRRTSQLMYTETDDMAEWGELHWSTNDADNLTTSAGYSTHQTRSHFSKYGNLTNALTREYRPIDLDEPVFAFVKSFRSCKKAQKALFTIGLVQDEVLQVNLPTKGYHPARPLYQRYFANATDMVVWHYLDYKHEQASAFADRMLKDSKKLNTDYAKITAISGIQAIGGTQLVVDDGDPHGEPHLWMKEISSDGNMQTSDVMFPAIPFFLYANPKLAVAMLEPLLVHQEAGLYPHK